MSTTDLAVLGLLSEQDLHGYELQKRLAELIGSRVSFGSLYPALSRLERDGAVRAVDADDALPAASPLPATGSLGGEAAAFRAALRQVRRGRRGKKVYGITDAGRHRLTELLEAPADDDRSFPLKVAFCHVLAPATRTRLLQRRRTQLADRLAVTRRTRAERGGATRWQRALLEHEIASVEHDLAWLDGLLAPSPEAASDDDQDPTPRIPTTGGSPR